MCAVGVERNDCDCAENASAPMPPASSFDPALLNASEWMNSVRDYGGQYAVLTVQAGEMNEFKKLWRLFSLTELARVLSAGCGFDLWPSNVSFPAAWGGGIYNYTVRESPFKRDLLREFVDAARVAGIRPGIYYIVNTNILLSRVYRATAAQTRAVIIGQLREIWSNYGEMVELWFDGGTKDPILGKHHSRIKPTRRHARTLGWTLWLIEMGRTLRCIAGTKIQSLLQELQPKAVCFQGPTRTQGIRWAGSESGHAVLPNWCVITAPNDLLARIELQ